MTEKEHQREKAKLLSQSKNKGLDQWIKVLSHYGIDIEKAKKGVYVPQMNSYIKLYFDVDQDKWLFKVIDPSAS